MLKTNNLKINKHGMALIMALAVIIILVSLVVELNRNVIFSATSSAQTRDAITVSQMAQSGIQIGMAILIKDKLETNIDSIQEDWANPDKISEYVSEFPFEEGNLNIKISDELSKIQVNSLVKFPEGQNFNESQKITWDRFARTLISKSDQFKDIEPTSIINSIKDWIDSGEGESITGLDGAESDYYKSLEYPYEAANQPFGHISELTLVKGMTNELLYGTDSIPGIIDYITVYGATKQIYNGKNSFQFEGKININTADLPVIAAIVPSENLDYAQTIYGYREEKKDSLFVNDLSSATWYKNAPGCNELQIDPNLVTTLSDFFKIESTAQLNQAQIKITAVVHREKDEKTGRLYCKILNCY